MEESKSLQRPQRDTVVTSQVSFVTFSVMTCISHSDSGGFPVYDFLSHPLGSQGEINEGLSGRCNDEAARGLKEQEPPRLTLQVSVTSNLSSSL